MITVPQPHVITKKVVNSDSNGFSSTGVDITTKTRRPQPRSNTKNDRVPSVSKSSRIKNKEFKVEDHPRNLLLSKNKKHILSECNNVKLAIRNDISKIVCAMCKQCLITANHDVCVLNYVNGMNSRGKKQKANISNIANLTKHMPLVKKPKKVGFSEKLASPKPSKSRMCLRWSPTGKMFDIKGKLIRSSDSEYLEVAFRRNTCFVRNLEGVDLLKGNRTTNLYTINLYDMASASPICLMARATSTKSWLWHQRLSHLNFDTINDLARNDLVTDLPKFKYHKEHLCPSCEQRKSKRASHLPKPVLNSKQRLHLLHMNLCGPMRIASINGKRKPDIFFLHVFGALCYPKNDREDIEKLGAKGDIGFFIGYSANSCAYRVYNQRTKIIMETVNVTFDELSIMAFEQSSLKLELQSMTSGQISSELDLPYASSTITSQKPTECELDLLFEDIYDDHVGGQPSAAPRTILAAQAPQVLQTPTATTTTADTAPTPANSSSQATNFPNTSQDVDEPKTQQQHVQHQPATIADNVPNAMFDDNTFVNPFATPSTSAAESSSSHYVDPSNMHTFYQPYPHKYQWTKDHPLEQVIGEPSRPVLTRNQLRSDGDMCMYALTVSTVEPKNVKEAMTDPAWIESIEEELLQFKRLNVWVLVHVPDNIKPLTLKWLFKNKHDEENAVIRNKTRLVIRG
ncbi:retrovirus-related pol polyprotein from transposon TNT 1-94 [Tanacetum coccineum]